MTSSPKRTAVGRDDRLGRRIRELRQEKGLSLSELARTVGVTRSFVSSLERGLAYPSIRVLRQIADAVEVPVFVLFIDADSAGIVVRKEERVSIALPNSPISYQLLSADVHHRMEMILMKLAPGAESAAMSHEGEECFLVLSGKVLFTVGGQEYECDEGDSVYYNSGLPHKLLVLGDKPVEIVSAITPPRF